jgi:DNA-damage-inducible protein D
MEEQNKVSPFESNNIRKIWHNEQCWFSIVDVIYVLTESKDPSNYWTMLKKREAQLSTICGKFKFLAPDGKMRATDCANTEGVLRIIMSIPSPKVEPLKQWMAQVSTQTIEETENPELGIERMRELYKAKGYTDEWIERRMQTIETRKQLTNEWKNRGVQEGQEYSILTATIAKGTFGLTPTEHKDLKGITKYSENLRDHMTPLELIFTALGEEVTRSLAIKSDVQGFEENHGIAQKGGVEAGKARKNLEKNTGLKVVSSESYLKSLKAGNDKNTEGVE